MKKILFTVIVIGVGLTSQSCNSPDKKAVKGDSVIAVGSGMDPGRDTGYTARKYESAAEQKKKKNVRGYTYEASVTTEDANFMDAAALGGMMEVDLAKKALQSSNAQVKSFAAMMISDHTKANKELASLAVNSGILLPIAYSIDQKEQLEKMKSLTGTEFDQHYMQMMVSDHSKTIALFMDGSDSISEEVKEFALKTLPVLNGHYKTAVAIRSSL